MDESGAPVKISLSTGDATEPAFAWWIWKLAHIYFLIGTRNRLSVALSWVWNHSIGYRGSRIIMHAISDKEPAALDKSGSLD